MQDIESHELPLSEVVYAVWDGEQLIHIGEGETIARPAEYVRNLRHKSSSNVRARYVLLDEIVRAKIPIPNGLPEQCSYRGNLERLLQSAFFWRHGRLPKEDRPRGGKGTVPSSTGGFIQSAAALTDVFRIFEKLVGSVPSMPRWPEISENPPEEAAPIQQAGRGRPVSRRLFLAFWIDFSLPQHLVANFGHIPLINGQPQYSAPTKQIVWSNPINPLSCDA